jgi:hypothetical protein
MRGNRGYQKGYPRRQKSGSGRSLGNIGFETLYVIEVNKYRIVNKVEDSSSRNREEDSSILREEKSSILKEETIILT